MLLALSLTPGCSPRIDACRDLVEAGETAAAAALCGRLFEETADPRLGRWAVEALHHQGQPGKVLELAERLRGTAAEADVLAFAVDVHRSQGRPAAAAAAAERQWELRRDRGDAAGAAVSAYRLAYLAWERSDYRRALEWAGRCYEDAAEAGDPTYRSLAMETLHVLLREVGDLAAAGRALAAARELLAPGDPAGRARLLVHHGLLQLDLGRPRLARRSFAAALAAAGEGAGRSLLRSTHLDLVKACLALGETAAAAAHLEEAAARSEGGDEPALLYYRARVAAARGLSREALAHLERALAGEPQPVWRRDLEVARGQVVEAMGDPAAAEAAYERAAAVVQELRAELGVDDLKAGLLDAERRPFEALVRLQAGSGRAREALATVERAKARTLHDAIVVSTAAEPAPEAAAGWYRQGPLARLTALDRLLPTLRESPPGPLAPVAALLGALSDLHARVYFSAEDEVWLLAAASGGVAAWRLGAAEVIEAEVRALARDPDDATLARRLGDRLFPAGSLPRRGSRLAIVPDGALGRLSFAALRPRGRLLVEGYAPFYAPSLNALAAMRARSRGGDAPGRAAAVILADPRGDLPAAAREAAVVGRLLGAPAFTGARARRSALESAAGARLLHLGAHTGLGPRGPWLRLADGEVGAAALLGGGIGPPVVVLASCASAARDGNGLWGSLAAVFLAAGTRAVVASLESVEDADAARLVLRFYRQGGDRDPVGALARAQRGLAASGWPPSAWAPFVALGSDFRLESDDRKETSQ